MPLDLTPAPHGRRRSFSVAMRIARRDIRRHRGRSLLIVLLIMLPVAGMTGAVTLVQSSMETPAERVEHELGQAQARYQSLSIGNNTSVQDPVNEMTLASSRGGWNPDFEPAEPQDVLPAGYSVLKESAFDVAVNYGQADVPVMGSQVDALNPVFAGKFSLLQGRAPSAVGEALVSPGMLERFGLSLGDDITTSVGAFTAVGTVRDAALSDRNAVLYLLPGQAPETPASGTPAAARATLYYLSGPGPVTWEQVRAANAVGVVVLSRHVALNPPPLDQRTVDGTPPDYVASVPFSAYLTAGYIGALALLEVGLLAGAAFAVGAKRQVRELALLAACGAEAPTVKAVVTAAGLWLGALAVASGAAVGLGGAAGVVFVARAIGSARFPGFHTDSLLTSGAMAMGLLACLLSAYAPARQISRQAALGALKSGRAPSGSPQRAARVGTGVLLFSIVSLLAGTVYAASTDHPDVLAERFPLIAGLLVGGAVLAVVALLVLVGPAIAVLAKRARWLSLAARMALRDASRNLGRTVPAVGAVLAAATLASAGMVVSATENERSSRNSSKELLTNQAQLWLGPAGAGRAVTTEDPKVIDTALNGTVDSLSWTQVLTYPRMIQDCQGGPLAELDEPARTAATNCLQYVLAVPAGNECIFTEQGRVRYPDDWRCLGPMVPYGGGMLSVLVGGADEIRATFGREAPEEATDILDAGGVVVTNPVFVKDGSAVLQVEDLRRPKESHTPANRYEVISSTELPAMFLEPVAGVRIYGVVSPATAERLDMEPEAMTLRLQFDSFPSDAEMEALRSEITALHGDPQGFYVQPATTGDRSLLIWGIVGLAALITLSAAGITTGLSLADARTDHMTLAGVGASPGLRKALAGSQALLTVGLGALLGCLAGVVPMLLILNSSEMKPYAAVPWLQLTALLVVVPLTAGALAWLFTRARLPMSRRAVGT